MLDLLGQHWSLSNAIHQMCVETALFTEQQIDDYVRHLDRAELAVLMRVDGSHAPQEGASARTLHDVASAEGRSHPGAAIEWVWMAYAKCRNALAPSFRRKLEAWLLQCWLAGDIPFVQWRSQKQRGIYPEPDLSKSTRHAGIPIGVLLLRPFRRTGESQACRVGVQAAKSPAAQFNRGRAAAGRPSKDCTARLRPAVEELARRKKWARVQSADGTCRFDAGHMQKTAVLRELGKLPKKFRESLTGTEKSTQLRALSNLVLSNRGRPSAAK